MARQKKVVPAILTDDPQVLQSMADKAATFTDYVQFDFMDGRFVPSHSITIHDLARLQTKLHWEAHLMVTQPEDYLIGLNEAGAEKVIFHYEATPVQYSVISQAKELNLKVGLAVNPETTVPTFLQLVDDVDSVLLLTVHPGFYGSKFIPEVLDKVKELREIRPELEIGADGGIKESNIIQIAKAGLDVCYVGSAIFLQPEPAEKYRKLISLIETEHDERR